MANIIEHNLQSDNRSFALLVETFLKRKAILVSYKQAPTKARNMWITKRPLKELKKRYYMTDSFQRQNRKDRKRPLKNVPTKSAPDYGLTKNIIKTIHNFLQEY